MAEMLTLPHVELSLTSVLGLMLWLARKAFWKFMWAVKEWATVSVDLLLLIWIEVLCGWVSEFGGGQLEVGVQQFLLALRGVLDMGVLPSKGQRDIVTPPTARGGGGGGGGSQ